MAKKDRFPGGYYRDAFETQGESEGSGSSGRVDMVAQDLVALLLKILKIITF